MSFAMTGGLAPEIKGPVVQGVKDASKKWHVSIPENFRFEYEKKEKRLGNWTLAKSTAATYEEHYKQLYSYCAIKRDYKSMLLLLLARQSWPNFKTGQANVFQDLPTKLFLDTCHQWLAMPCLVNTTLAVRRCSFSIDMQLC